MLIMLDFVGILRLVLLLHTTTQHVGCVYAKKIALNK
jgi:hypothetical protein